MMARPPPGGRSCQCLAAAPRPAALPPARPRPPAQLDRCGGGPGRPYHTCGTSTRAACSCSLLPPEPPRLCRCRWGVPFLLQQQPTACSSRWSAGSAAVRPPPQTCWHLPLAATRAPTPVTRRRALGTPRVATMAAQTCAAGTARRGGCRGPLGGTAAASPSACTRRASAAVSSEHRNDGRLVVPACSASSQLVLHVAAGAAPSSPFGCPGFAPGTACCPSHAPIWCGARCVGLLFSSNLPRLLPRRPLQLWLGFPLCCVCCWLPWQ
jgi:hypothetical protein